MSRLRHSLLHWIPGGRRERSWDFHYASPSIHKDNKYSSNYRSNHEGKYRKLTGQDSQGKKEIGPIYLRIRAKVCDFGMNINRYLVEAQLDHVVYVHNSVFVYQVVSISGSCTYGSGGVTVLAICFFQTENGKNWRF